MPRPGGLVAGRYEVIEILGVGGYAIVYRARDERLGDEVALKVLDPYKSNRQQFAARFRQEVRVVRQLKHHNTIKIQDVGVTDDDCLFMAMEFVEGETLKELVERSGGLEPGRVVRIAAQILRSLDEAHALGVIHRDLKPSNVMVSQLRGEPDYVKVLDFGIAKALSPELSHVKTQTTELMCTPGYAAPELLDGRGIGPETDLYALGLMMIEMLTGRDVFEDSNLWAIVHKQLSEEPIAVPPEVAAMPLGRVIERAVRKPMAERYPDAQSMLADLLRLGLYPREMPTLTAPRRGREGGEVEPTRWGRADRRHRLALALIIVSLLVMAASTAVIVVRYARGRAVGGLLDAGPGARGEDASGDAVAGGERDVGVADVGLALTAEVGDWVEAASHWELCESGDSAACLLAVAELSEADGEARQRLLERACEGGLAHGCLALGELLEASARTREEHERVLGHYLAACNATEAEGCVRAGAMYASARGVPRNDVEAVRLYRQACNFGVMDGCVNLGWMYFSGQGVGQSYELAHSFFQQACNGGNVTGCGVLGFLYHQGYGFGQNFELARFHYQNACSGGDMTGCTGLGALYEQGLGVAVDRERAFALYEQACAGEAGTACNRLGQIYRDGVGVEADPERARSFFARACEVGYSQACSGAP